MSYYNTPDELYFSWISLLAIKDDEVRNRYSILLENLWRTPFVYIIPLDENRAIDGTRLRYRFGYLHGYTEEEIYNGIDNGRPCSVLEMMVALAFRSEEHIMQNPSNGDRTSQWFIDMLDNLRLLSMTNDNFDENYFGRCMHIFMSREYSPNGRGGLFTVKYPRRDMRYTEIWYQCMWYFEELMKEEK